MNNEAVARARRVADESETNRRCSYQGDPESGIVLHSAKQRATVFVKAGKPAQQFMAKWLATNSDVKHDVLRKLDELIPKHESYYQHDEGNSDSHVKTSLVGNSATVLIEHGDLVLGRWQGIYFCEFDGPRDRELYVKLIDFNPTTD